MPPERRDDVGADPGEEIGAIAWSYAAATHLGLGPAVVFHEHGYRGASRSFLDNFRHGRYVGVPLLQWMDLTRDDRQAREEGRPLPAHAQVAARLTDGEKPVGAGAGGVYNVGVWARPAGPAADDAPAARQEARA